MKILDISPITDSSEFPVKRGTLQFLQDAHKESLSRIIQGIIGSGYSSSVVYILWGATNSGTYPSYNITAGAAFYNGEVFDIDATAFTASGTNVGIFQIVTTQYTTDADPVTFSDSAIRNVHNIRKIQIAQGASGSGTLPDYSQAFFLNIKISTTTISAPSSGAYAGNLIQIITGFPDYELFVAPSTNPNPILYADTLHVGDVGGTGSDFTITFPSPLSTGNYYVMGSFVSGGLNTRQDTTIQFSIRNRLNTGFTVHFEEFSPGVQNIDWDYIVFAK